eukprot:1153418-Pelagomonas_calceolata.AAC.6
MLEVDLLTTHTVMITNQKQLVSRDWIIAGHVSVLLESSWVRLQMHPTHGRHIGAAKGSKEKKVHGLLLRIAVITHTGHHALRPSHAQVIKGHLSCACCCILYKLNRLHGLQQSFCIHHVLECPASAMFSLHKQEHLDPVQHAQAGTISVSHGPLVAHLLMYSLMLTVPWLTMDNSVVLPHAYCAMAYCCLLCHDCLLRVNRLSRTASAITGGDEIGGLTRVKPFKYSYEKVRAVTLAQAFHVDPSGVTLQVPLISHPLHAKHQAPVSRENEGVFLEIACRRRMAVSPTRKPGTGWQTNLGFMHLKQPRDRDVCVLQAPGLLFHGVHLCALCSPRLCTGFCQRPGGAFSWLAIRALTEGMLAVAIIVSTTLPVYALVDRAPSPCQTQFSNFQLLCLMG